MSTQPHASGVDLFVTDLEANRVTRVTTGSNIGISGVRLAWNASGTGLLLSRFTGEGGAPLFEPVSSIVRVNIATGAQTPIAQDLASEVFGIADDPGFVILSRRTGVQNGDYLVLRRP